MPRIAAGEDGSTLSDHSDRIATLRVADGRQLGADDLDSYTGKHRPIGRSYRAFDENGVDAQTAGGLGAGVADQAHYRDLSKYRSSRTARF